MTPAIVGAALRAVRARSATERMRVKVVEARGNESQVRIISHGASRDGCLCFCLETLLKQKGELAGRVRHDIMSLLTRESRRSGPSESPRDSLGDMFLHEL